jgi:hypothetical protein
MFRWMILVISVLAVAFVPLRAQEKPVLVVHAFTVASGIDFPYDMKDLQAQALTEINAKDGDEFSAVTDNPATQARVYVLDGEVLDWHKGNKAEQLFIAGGSVAGRENAKIHFWLTDKDGKKVFETTDEIRQLFMRNRKEKSVGTLTRPFADTLSERLKDANPVPVSD